MTAAPGHTASSAADDARREEALDPARSFIVQAPAGSGKTELLIERLLVLLASVERPEQVLAITFTKKAAGEMRQRLLDALAEAASAHDGVVATPGERLRPETLRRARAVVERDLAMGWELRASPGRLRIQTIDALCSAIARERPVLSGLGEAPAITDDPDTLYQAAARAVLAALEQGGEDADAVERLLLHLDGDFARAEGLLASLLARRDQWLRHVRPGEDPAALRPALEAELRAAIDEELGSAHAALGAVVAGNGPHLAAELAALGPAAAAQVALIDPEAPIARLQALTGLPAPEADALPLWQGLAALLTTSAGEGAWRKALNKNQGFPTDKAVGDPVTLKALKQRATDMLGALAHRPELAVTLRRAAALPPPAYTEAQWAVLVALLTVLPRAVAQLRAAFAEAGAVDYVEVALGALRALEASPPGANGAPGAGAPVDEARHILVDEFQDTSHGQYRLLERLTAHWPADGSHTLFLVGDPMQSIYRFREAEVGLFLRAQQEGIGPVRLQALRLEVNFRSTEALVGWVNETFPRVLAPVPSLAEGAVPFAPSLSHQRGAEGAGVVVHVRTHGAGAATREHGVAAEAQAVAELVATCRAERPEETIGVLVRARGHLGAILPALQRAGLPFQAVEIEALAGRSEVRDLLMLLRALAHPGDRVAWLAVLRAPWCGLSLGELLHLGAPLPGGPPAQPTVWERLGDPAVRAGLPPEAQARAERVVAALAPSLAGRERRPLRRWLEGAWLALGGPACVPAAAWSNVEACLARLEGLPADVPLAGPEQTEALLEHLFAAPDPAADPRLQVMSIHKAKGLQFDTVIVPAMERVPRSGDKPLLRWAERPRAAPGGAGLLLAPISEPGVAGVSAFDYLKRLEQDRDRHESGRLLYVACTRARRALHLFGDVRLGKDGPKPDARSFLARLWPALEPEFAAADAEEGGEGAGANEERPAPSEAPASTLQRLVAGWVPPAAPLGIAVPAAVRAEDADEPDNGPYAIEFRWAGEVARHVGTLVHRLLCQIARQGAERWQTGAAFRPEAVAAALGALGVPAADQADASARVLEALRRTLADERGRWVLAPHAEARSELALTGWMEGRTDRFIIDRTFVDEQGVRWIVDFKTGSHEGGDLEAFLAREQERYRAQLEGYAALMAALEPGRSIRLALYFPLMQAWREWAAASARGEASGLSGALP